MSDEKPFPPEDSSWSDQALANKAAADKAAAEPAKATGPLPDDFPGRAALADADVNTYTQLRKLDDVRAVPGIGEATAAKIAAALDAADKGA